MSHTLNIENGCQIVSMTIQNYTSGGEQVTLAELGNRLAIDGVILSNIPASANSLGVPLFPILDGGKVKLFRFVSGSPAEIPTTANLNASLVAIIV